jgi:hypothetical protein
VWCIRGPVPVSSLPPPSLGVAGLAGATQMVGGLPPRPLLPGLGLPGRGECWTCLAWLRATSAHKGLLGEVDGQVTGKRKGKHGKASDNAASYKQAQHPYALPTTFPRKAHSYNTFGNQTRPAHLAPSKHTRAE